MHVGMGVGLAHRRGGASFALPPGSPVGLWPSGPTWNFKDAAMAQPCAVGDKIWSRKDISGLNHHLKQPDSTRQGTLRQDAHGYYVEDTWDGSIGSYYTNTDGTLVFAAEFGWAGECREAGPNAPWGDYGSFVTSDTRWCMHVPASGSINGTGNLVAALWNGGAFPFANFDVGDASVPMTLVVQPAADAGAVTQWQTNTIDSNHGYGTNKNTRALVAYAATLTAPQRAALVTWLAAFIA